MSATTPAPSLSKRQIWGLPTATLSTPATCRTYVLPSGAELTINALTTLTLSGDATYEPPCTGLPPFVSGSANVTFPIDNSNEPFYASVAPLVYVVAATTILAWMLLFFLLVTPGARSQTLSARLNYGWRQGRSWFGAIIGRPSILSRGTRPILQKAAALLIAVAMTTVTADTFNVAQRQYLQGYMSAGQMRQEVTGSLEVRIIRVISDLFLWLAQIQTLIRLFPRHKEKLAIKWLGFLLICLDIIFSSLNSFGSYGNAREPRAYQDAIPALSYLFQLALSLLYAAWVLYYSITKRRYAYYHPMMPNICIVALISVISILIPVVFFLVDILKPQVGASWGDYFRWVGSAAASIVVWEWVERIEALESEEKKDGILGREIFDEDDVLGTTALDRSNSDPSSDRGNFAGGVSRAVGQYGGLGAPFQGVGKLSRRFAGAKASTKVVRSESPVEDEKSSVSMQDRQQDEGKSGFHISFPGLARPPRAADPVDRTHNTSTNSTQYTVHYHPVVRTPELPRATAARVASPLQMSNLASRAADREDPEATAAASEEQGLRSRWFQRGSRFAWRHSLRRDRTTATPTDELGNGSTAASPVTAQDVTDASGTRHTRPHGEPLGQTPSDSSTLHGSNRELNESPPGLSQSTTRDFASLPSSTERRGTPNEPRVGSEASPPLFRHDIGERQHGRDVP